MAHIIYTGKMMLKSICTNLSIGFYLGILFKGELLYSTLLAILISGCIGFLVGLRFHLYTARQSELRLFPQGTYRVFREVFYPQPYIQGKRDSL